MNIVIATRFNIADIPPERMATAAPSGMDAWLADRVELIRAYSLPSILAQTDRDFTWVVMCSPRTPAPIRRKLNRMARTSDPAIVFDFSGDSARDMTLRSRTDEVFVSCRLDSDDALHRRYVETIRDMAGRVSEWPCVLSMPGHKYDASTGQAYAINRYDMPFFAFAEREDYRGVYSTGQHTHVERRYPMMRDSLRGWLWVMHGGNICNKGVEGLTPDTVELADYGL